MILWMPVELASWGTVAGLGPPGLEPLLTSTRSFLGVQELDVPAKVWPEKGFLIFELRECPHQTGHSWGSGNTRGVLRSSMGLTSIGSKHRDWLDYGKMALRWKINELFPKKRNYSDLHYKMVLEMVKIKFLFAVWNPPETQLSWKLIAIW